MKRIDVTMFEEEGSSVEELKEKLRAFNRESNTLAVSVRNDSEYRSNPNNWYHSEYQRALNRQFLLFLHLFSVLWIGVFYGRNALVAYLFGMAMVYLFTVCCWLLKQILPDLISVFKQFFIEGRYL